MPEQIPNPFTSTGARSGIVQIYPFSRIKQVQCDKCRGVGGILQTKGYVKVEDEAGEAVRLMRVACNKCGYTMLFDAEVRSTSPFQGEGVEELPAKS